MEAFLTLLKDGNVHVTSERFRRGVKTMGGSFQLGHWDVKTKKWLSDVNLHWKYRKYDPEWTFRELRMKAYWPIVDPWIRKRLIADDLSFDEAPKSARHERARV
jgi:hypothetical protein